MAFNFFRLESSAKMMLPSFLRSSVPSGKRTWFPKVASILARAVVPGSTTWRAIMSASTTGILEALKRAETVDFPVAMPPVSPITIKCEIGKYQKQILVVNSVSAPSISEAQLELVVTVCMTDVTDSFSFSRFSSFTPAKLPAILPSHLTLEQ